LFIWLLVAGNIIALSANVNSMRKYRKHKTTRRTKGSKNKWVRLIEGLASGFTGVEEIGEKLVGCIKNIRGLVTGKEEDTAADTTVESTVKPEAQEPTTKLGTFVKVAAWITKGVCLFKGSILDAVKNAIGLRKKNNRRYQKMLIQKSLRRGKWDKVKEYAKEVKEWTQDKWKDAKEKYHELAGYLVDIKDKVKDIVVGWWNSIKESELFKFIVKWSGCAQVVAGVAGAIYKLVKLGIWIAKTAASHGGTLAMDVPLMVVNLICKWPELLDAAKKFKDAWTTKDVLKKYYSYAFFVGKMFSITIDVIVDRKQLKKQRKHRKLM